MMALTSMPLAVVLLILGIQLPAPSVSQELVKPLPIDFCNVAIKTSERLSLEACVGPSCKPRCNGICKSQCGPSDSIGWGYCGKGCQCCQKTLPSCPYNSRCGSGGKCRSGNRCPKGEKPIPGRCGFIKGCICCAPDKPTGTCPAPFIKVGSEYFYFHDSSKMNWDDALKHCKSIGGSLAEPANMDDFIDLIETDYSHMKYDIWLGATDRSVEQSWKWVSGGSVPSALWPAWPGNQPSGDGDCMQIHYHGYSGFFLNDYYCRVKGYFVCECEPRVIDDCQGKCTTNKGSGSCKNSCSPGEERLGSCPGGKCSCCGKRDSGSCTLMGKIYASGTVFHKNCMKFYCREGKWISSNQYNAKCDECKFNNDPHFRTFDNVRFDWHGHSTYVISQVGCEDCPDMYVAGLFQDCTGGLAWATCVHTVYFQPDPSTKIEIVKDNTLSNSQIIIDGYTQNLIGVAAGELKILQGAGGVEHPAFAWMKDGCIHIMGFGNEGYLVKICSWGASVFAYPSMQNNLCGLCGNWDGNPANDIRFRDGTIMDPPPQGPGIPWVDQQVETNYGNHWEVQDCEGNDNIISAMNQLSKPVNAGKPCEATKDEVKEYIRRCERLNPNDQDLIDDCAFDQCIATKSGDKSLAAKWLAETRNMIKEVEQQKQDTAVYIEDLLTACKGKCTVNGRRGYCSSPALCRSKTEVGPSPCGRGCICCSHPIPMLQPAFEMKVEK